MCDAAAVKMCKMTESMIAKHGLESKLAGYVSDTPTTMRSLWQMLKQRYPRIIIVGCLDHCLDLFLRSSAEQPQVNDSYLLLLAAASPFSFSVTSALLG